MADQRQRPQSVPDVDGLAWRRMAASQRALNAAQEYRYEQRRADTVELVDRLNTAADLAPAVVAGLSGHEDDLKAAKAAGRFTGAAGKVIGPVQAATGYQADRAAGKPKDEAVIKNVGGFLLAAGLTAAVPEAAIPIWAARGISAAVGMASTPVAGLVADQWRGVKRRFADDPYWRDKVNMATSPTFMMRNLGRGR